MELNIAKRRIILNYRFVDSLSYGIITRKIRGVSVDGVRKLYIRTRERASSDNIAIIT